MLDYLVCNGVVVVGQDLGVPLDGDEAFLDQVFLEDWSICWQDNAAIALFEPVAERARVTSPIYSLEDEGREDTFA